MNITVPSVWKRSQIIVILKENLKGSLKKWKLPKKYQEKPKVQIAPVNAFVPPQSKLSKEELDAQMTREAEERRIKEEAAREKKRKEKLEEERIERNRAAVLRESKYISWVNPHVQGNYRSIHSEEYQRKVNKKTPFYY